MRRSRVLVAAAGLGLGLLTLWLRVGWLQVVRHDAFARRAELNHEQRVLIKPVRGSLVDRHGRALARDLVTYSVSAAPREMKSPRDVARALARALDMPVKRLERAFQSRPRYLWVERQVSPEVANTILEQDHDGVYLSVETRREHLLGPAALEVLGRTNLDNAGIEGLELQFDDDLRGRPGWVTRLKDGRGRSHDLPGAMKRSPEDGRHVHLTIDADLQSILESHLARAIDTLDAVRAFGLFLDPRTGEILACVNVPHLGPGKSKNWAFTDQVEPGSTYKLVVAGAALEEGVARPEQVFEAAASGVAQVAPGAVFTDVHAEAEFTFRDAVRWSSNIVMGRLAMKLGDERFYRHATALGFGSLTGVAFPGESGGKLRSPEQWSARSCPTLAIGYEVGVTPLQLALAYAAVANGGVLMQPLLVREIRGPDDTVVRRFRPHASHRVWSDRTTRLMREMLQAVVDSGTARAARVPGLAVAGKTGTARKYDPTVGAYTRNYISSFAGFAPADDPALVGVIVIDDPRGGRYYGGEIAAPVFREVLLDLQRLPDSPLRTASGIAARPPAPAPVVVPDLHLIPAREAERRLHRDGLRVRVEGEGPRVLAQSPAAGVAVERGASVHVWLAPPQDSTGHTMPDVTGLALRSALRRLGLVQVQARIEGSGTVVRQSPAPGTPLPLPRGCRLWCEPVPPAPGRPAVDAVAAAAGSAP
jgi:stage V sporulation protein D (sporulation-specific penicillin-binding protein)